MVVGRTLSVHVDREDVSGTYGGRGNGSLPYCTMPPSGVSDHIRGKCLRLDAGSTGSVMEAHLCSGDLQV